MSFSDNKKILRVFYDKRGLLDFFEEDCLYLESAFNEISKIWVNNFYQIEKVNYLMIAEAPLWGKAKKYVYNHEINNSQFFYRSDLGDILNKNITDKKSFIKVCNEIGLLVVDISPFPFNPEDTKVSYKKSKEGGITLTKKEYKELVSLTIPTFFEQKIKLVKEKSPKELKTFFRYARVKNSFQDIVGKVLIGHKIIKNINEIGDISQSGGGIDKTKLKQIIF